MGARSKARKKALDILFESELQGLPPGATLAGRQAAAEVPLNDYTVRLVEGVASQLADIDAMIARHASGWPLARMPAVDRNIVRIGVYELRCDEVPPAVVLSEAVSLARELSTAESPAFVNGVLATIAGLFAGEPHQYPAPPAASVPATPVAASAATAARPTRSGAPPAGSAPRHR